MSIVVATRQGMGYFDEEEVGALACSLSHTLRLLTSLCVINHHLLVAAKTGVLVWGVLGSLGRC